MRETRKGRLGAGEGSSTHSPDDRVEHERFGSGTILEADERYTTIAFDESGTRKFVTSMVELAPSDTPAPVTVPKKKRKAAKRRSTKRPPSST